MSPGTKLTTSAATMMHAPRILALLVSMGNRPPDNVQPDPPNTPNPVWGAAKAAAQCRLREATLIVQLRAAVSTALANSGRRPAPQSARQRTARPAVALEPPAPTPDRALLKGEFTRHTATCGPRPRPSTTRATASRPPGLGRAQLPGHRPPQNHLVPRRRRHRLPRRRDPLVRLNLVLIPKLSADAQQSAQCHKCYYATSDNRTEPNPVRAAVRTGRCCGIGSHGHK